MGRQGIATLRRAMSDPDLAWCVADAEATLQRKMTDVERAAVEEGALIAAKKAARHELWRANLSLKEMKRMGMIP